MVLNVTALVGAVTHLLGGNVREYVNLPVVDLGFELHQAIEFNTTGQFYNFSNIRYAQPPVGQLRFAAPQPMPTKRQKSEVNRGDVGYICPQASPAWENIAAAFIPAYLTGAPFNYSQAQASAANFTVPEPAPNENEDCLFLDIYVPERAFNTPVNQRNKGAPVMVWIYGGGYATGDKRGSGVYNPAGLINASQADGGPGVILVAINYRLGALGWLGGPTLQSQAPAQPALYDQRLALIWVRDNIAKFGGDKNRVTVFGESAGGGSIMHQITAYGGQQPVPFQQAILQSPAWQPLPGAYQQEQVYENFMRTLNVSTIEEARALDSARVIRANAETVAKSQYGSFTYGPLVDGFFTPQLPGLLLNSGAFAKNLKVMVGHNSDEGLLFSDPIANQSTGGNELDFTRALLPSISNRSADYIYNVLYPADYSGAQNYSTPFQRFDKVVSESTFDCNTYYLTRAFGNQTYAYEFSVFPGLHGQDIPYTWYNAGSSSGAALLPIPVNGKVANAMQAYFTSFATNGAPSGTGIPRFNIVGNDDSAIDFSGQGVSTGITDTDNDRCRWWQKAQYY